MKKKSLFLPSLTFKDDPKSNESKITANTKTEEKLSFQSTKSSKVPPERPTNALCFLITVTSQDANFAENSFQLASR